MRQFCPYIWKGTLLGMRCPNCDCSDGPDIAAAQAIETRRAKTGTGAVHESAVGNADASDAALLADICDNMAEVLKPLPGIPDAPGSAGTRATESGDGDEA